MTQRHRRELRDSAQLARAEQEVPRRRSDGTDEDDAGLSGDDQRKLAAIRAELDREADATLEPGEVGTDRAHGGGPRWLVPTVVGAGLAVLVLSGVVVWKVARAPLPHALSVHRVLPADAPASSSRSRIASKTEAPAAQSAPSLDRTGNVAMSGSPPTAPAARASTAATLAATTSVAASIGDTEKLESRLTRLETEPARLREAAEELREQVRVTKARVNEGETTAQQVPAELSPGSRPRAAYHSVARPVERTVAQPASVGSRPSVATPGGDSDSPQDRSGVEGEVISASPAAALPAAGSTLAEPQVRPPTTSNFGRTETPALSRTMSVDDPPPIVRRSESREPHQPWSSSEEWARIKKETAEFADEAKAGGRQIADGVRRLGRRIKEVVGAD